MSGCIRELQRANGRLGVKADGEWLDMKWLEEDEKEDRYWHTKLIGQQYKDELNYKDK